MAQKLKSILILFVLLGFSFIASAQSNIGINNPTPNASSVLDLTSTTQGFLTPRMTAAQRIAIATPATGLLVFDLTISRFMFYNGAAWNGLTTSATGWETTGNTGTNPATNFLGTIDNADLVIRTFNVERARFDVNGSVGINQTAPDLKSILHITSTTKGVLFPRLTSAQRTTLISNGSAADASRDGLLVYDTNLKNFLSWNSTGLRWDTIMTRSGGSGLYWKLLGNTGTDTTIHYIGTTDSTDLVFRTNGRERFRIKANGLFYTSNQGPGTNNILMGATAGSLTTGSNNAAFGLQSLQNNTTGSGNSALGSYALLNNTTGNENTGVGIESLRNNTTGYGNTSVGERSGFGNTTAYGNTSVGRYSIFNNQIGLENVGIGDSVLFGTSTDVGDFNVAVGNRVLFRNTGNQNVGMGYLSLYANTTGYSNVGIGTQSMIRNTIGYQNVGIGAYALNRNVAGRENIGIGYAGGFGIVDGDFNVSIGHSTMFNARNASSNFNVALGYFALYTDTIPLNNVAIGYHSMYYGVQRDANVAIGREALRGAVGAGTFNIDRNVAIGNYAGQLITTGDDNVFIGTNAGTDNSSGINNVYVGTNAGTNSTIADNNVFIGTTSGQANISGDENVFAGHRTGFANTTGNLNVFVGTQAGESNTIGTQNTFAGWWAGRVNTQGQANAFFGTLAGFSTTLGNGNTFIGAATGTATTTGDNNTYLGWTANGAGNYNNSAALGYGAITWGSNYQRFGDDNTLKWGFGTNAIAGRSLQVGTTAANGNGAYLTNGGIWTNTSDRNKKEDFTNLNKADILSSINNLEITRWKYKGTEVPEYHIGPMAQDFYRLFNVGMDSLSISSLDPAGIALIGIQQLSKLHGNADKKIDALEKQNTELKTLFEQYKASTTKEIEELRKLIESLKQK